MGLTLALLVYPPHHSFLNDVLILLISYAHEPSVCCVATKNVHLFFHSPRLVAPGVTGLSDYSIVYHDPAEMSASRVIP